MKGEKQHVVIIGAGFAGLFATKALFGKNLRVTLIDKNNYHTFNPLLYQVGAALIEADQIAYPVRSFIRKKNNIDFLMADVLDIKFKKNTVITSRGNVHYDYLILSAGSVSAFFGVKGADKYTLTLKNLDDALILRNHVLLNFEKASWCDNDEERKRCLNFVIIGGGPTGVEFAGALAEFVQGPLRKDFPGIDYRDVQITLVDAAKQLLGMYSQESAQYVKEKLESMNVKVFLNTSVSQVKKGEIILSNGQVIKTNTVLWSAGVRGSSLKTDIKFKTSRDMRIEVDNTLRPAGLDNVFICGDMAFLLQDDKPLPMIAPVATQEGIHSAKNILRMIDGKDPIPFRYKDKGAMVTIGRNSAVTRVGNMEWTGFIAWVLWLFIHVLYLIGFRNKILVMMSWFRDYLFFERSGKMIIPKKEE
ncbi:MAG: NAD(P)/FAD-dependent oxidoreductase [Spirochaetes bacterium]|nr:NAD(P)/FAD-dependent oxidoreductase [Spirochaetota bacterium]